MMRFSPNGAYKETADDVVENLSYKLEKISEILPRAPLTMGIESCIDDYIRIKKLSQELPGNNYPSFESIIEEMYFKNIQRDRILFLCKRLYDLGEIDVSDIQYVIYCIREFITKATPIEKSNCYILMALLAFEYNINTSCELSELLIYENYQNNNSLSDELKFEFLSLLLKFTSVDVELIQDGVYRDVALEKWFRNNIYPLANTNTDFYFNFCIQALFNTTFFGNHGMMSNELVEHMEAMHNKHPEVVPNLFPETCRVLNTHFIPGESWIVRFVKNAATIEYEKLQTAKAIIQKICESFKNNYDLKEQILNFQEAIKIAPGYRMQFIQQIRDSVVNHPNLRSYFFIIELFRSGIITRGEFHKLDLYRLPTSISDKKLDSNILALLSLSVDFCKENYNITALKFLELIQKLDKRFYSELAYIAASGKLPCRGYSVSFDQITGLANAATEDVRTDLWFQRVCKSTFVGSLNEYYTATFSRQRVSYSLDEKLKVLEKELPKLSGQLSKETKTALIKDDILNLTKEKYPKIYAYLAEQLKAEKLRLLIDDYLHRVKQDKSILSAAITLDSLFREPFEFQEKLHELMRLSSPDAQNCILYYGIWAFKNGSCNAEDFITEFLLPFNDSMLALKSKDEADTSYYAMRLCLLAIGYNLVGNKFATIEKCISITEEVKEIPAEIADEVRSIIAMHDLSKIESDKNVSALKTILERFEYAVRYGHDLDAYLRENIALFESEEVKNDKEFLKTLCASTQSKQYVYYFAIKLARLGKITAAQFKKDVLTDLDDCYPSLLEDNVRDIAVIRAISCFYADEPQRVRIAFVNVFDKILTENLILGPAIEAEFFHIILNEKLPLTGLATDPLRLLKCLLKAKFHDPNIKINLLLQSCYKNSYVGRRLRKSKKRFFDATHEQLIVLTLLSELQIRNIEILPSAFIAVLDEHVYADLGSIDKLQLPLDKAITSSWVAIPKFDDRVLSTFVDDKPTDESIQIFLELIKNNHILLMNCLFYTINKNICVGLNLANELLNKAHITKDDYQKAIDVMLYVCRKSWYIFRENYTKAISCLIIAFHKIGDSFRLNRAFASLFICENVSVVDEAHIFGLMLTLPPGRFKDISSDLVRSNFITRNFRDKNLQKNLLVRGLIPGTFMFSVFNPDITEEFIRQKHRIAAGSVAAELNNNWNAIPGIISQETINLIEGSGILQNNEFSTSYPKLHAQLMKLAKTRDYMPEVQMKPYGYLDL